MMNKSLIDVLMGFTIAAIGSMFLPFQWWMIPTMWVFVISLDMAFDYLIGWEKKEGKTT